jgi:ComF family protein
MTRGTLRAALTGVAHSLLAVALAPRCATCDGVLDRPIDGPVCGPCWEAIRIVSPPVCHRCGTPLPSWRIISVATTLCARCRRSPGVIERGAIAGEYEGALRHIIHAFKYDGRRSLGVRLGRMMRDSSGDLLRDAHGLVPVPMHPVRRLHRGFNHASDLARAVGGPVIHALWRTRATVPQAGLNASTRRTNVRGAFRLSPLLRRATRAGIIEDRVLVLVDDVRTTGATLDACARALKRAGAREVRTLVAARASLRR